VEQRDKGVHFLQHRWKSQPAVWVVVGLILVAAAVVTLIFLNRPATRAYQDAVLVFAEVAAL
jgi:flagellar biosynthesis/type III secretory pathway M-ring protein FliF/YscJ